LPFGGGVAVYDASSGTVNSGAGTQGFICIKPIS
jgi:hypothetical protein